MKLTLLLVTFSWLGSSLAGLWYLADKRLVSFDPELSLFDSALSLTFDQQLSEAFKQEFGSVKNTAFHLRDDNCFCSALSDNHIQEVSQTLTEVNFINTSVTPVGNSKSALIELLPATPAVVIFGENEQLLFAGPYNQGLSCSAKGGFVESLIVSLQQKVMYGAIIISDAKGCYCHT